MKKLWLVVLAILVVISSVIVTAKIVQYLSNKAIVNVDVSSPLEITVNDGTFDVFGGESFVIDMSVINHANMVLSGNMTTIITNDDGITCGDFDNIKVDRSVNNAANITFNPACIELNETNVDIALYSKPFGWGNLENHRLFINITMDSGAVGSYVLETQVLL